MQNVENPLKRGKEEEKAFAPSYEGERELFGGKNLIYGKRRPGEKQKQLFLGLSPLQEKYLKRRKFLQKPTQTTPEREVFRKRANRIMARRFNKEVKDRRNLAYYRKLSGNDDLTLEDVKKKRKPYMDELSGLYVSPDVNTDLGDFPIPKGLNFQRPYGKAYFDKMPYMRRTACVKSLLDKSWEALPEIQKEIYGTKKRFKKMGPLKEVCETQQDQDYWKKRNYGKTRKERQPGTKLTAHQIYFAKLMKSIGAAWRNLPEYEQKTNYGSYTNFVSAVFSAIQKARGRAYGSKLNYNYGAHITIPEDVYEGGYWRGTPVLEEEEEGERGKEEMQII